MRASKWRKPNILQMAAIIADDNTITDQIELAKNFYNFFTSIGTYKPPKENPSY